MSDQYRKCRLNNMKMQALRKEFTYQAVIIDLALAGLIDKEGAENLLGYKIPTSLQLPAWCSSSSSDSTISARSVRTQTSSLPATDLFKAK